MDRTDTPSSSENCLPNQIRQSTLSLAAGQDILHHRSAVDEGSCQYCWGVLLVVRHAVPLVAMNNRRPCTRSGVQSRKSAHVKTSYFRARSPARSRCSGGHESLACISCSKSLKTWTASPPDARTVAIVVVARRTSTAIAQSGTVSVGVSCGDKRRASRCPCIFK